MHKRIRLIADQSKEIGARLGNLEQAPAMAPDPATFQSMNSSQMASMESQKSAQSIDSELHALNEKVNRFTTSCTQKLEDLPTTIASFERKMLTMHSNTISRESTAKLTELPSPQPSSVSGDEIQMAVRTELLLFR